MKTLAAIEVALTLAVALPLYGGERSGESCVRAAIEAGPADTLTVRVTGLRADEGRGAFAIYDSAVAFDERTDPVATATREIVDGTCEWRLAGLAPGDYAIAFYHDRNANGELDRNKLGIPREAYGFSRDARSAFGPPSFDAARVRYAGGEAVIELAAR